MTAAELLALLRERLPVDVRATRAQGLILARGGQRTAYPAGYLLLFLARAIETDANSSGSWLAVLQMRGALGRFRYDPEGLLERLEEIGEFPWPAVVEAVRCQLVADAEEFAGWRLRWDERVAALDSAG